MCDWWLVQAHGYALHPLELLHLGCQKWFGSNAGLVVFALASAGACPLANINFPTLTNQSTFGAQAGVAAPSLCEGHLHRCCWNLAQNHTATRVSEVPQSQTHWKPIFFFAKQMYPLHPKQNALGPTCFEFETKDLKVFWWISSRHLKTKVMDNPFPLWFRSFSKKDQTDQVMLDSSLRHIRNITMTSLPALICSRQLS